MKTIIKHTYCTLEKCPYIGKLCKIEEEVKVSDTETYYWARLENGKQIKVAKEDLE